MKEAEATRLLAPALFGLKNGAEKSVSARP